MTDTDKLYKIKPLEWAKEPYGVWRAKTPFCSYSAWSDGWRYCSNVYWESSELSCTSIEEGKAAAEAHWRERILPMLTEVE